MLYILISLVLIFLILLYKAYTYDQAHLYRVIMIGEITEEDIEEEIKKEQVLEVIEEDPLQSVDNDH